MIIQVLEENLFNDYDDFLLKNKNNLFYASSKYLLFLEKVLNCKSHVLIVKVDDSIIACLPLMFKDGNLGRVYNSLPFYGSNGGIISNTESATSLLIKKYNEITSEDNVASSNYIENPLNKIPLESLINYNEEDYRIGQFTPLNLDNPHKSQNKDLTLQGVEDHQEKMYHL